MTETPMPDGFRDAVAAAKRLPANDPPPEREPDVHERQAGDTRDDD